VFDDLPERAATFLFLDEKKQEEEPVADRLCSDQNRKGLVISISNRSSISSPFVCSPWNNDDDACAGARSSLGHCVGRVALHSRPSEL
jgi:hypothetical protein